MKKHGVLLTVLFFVLLTALSGFGVKFYTHEQWQSQRIHDLMLAQENEHNSIIEVDQKIQYLQQQIESLKSEDISSVEYDADAFNYLAIGNSITLHGKCDYWWNEIGMAASLPEKDYFHLVTDYLNTQHSKVLSYAYNFSIWETHSADRTQTVNSLTKYLSADLDLITIQLSENATNLDTFVVDFKELIALLQKSCPSASIILVDDFWSTEKSELKKQVANELGIPFASFINIRGIEEYMCGLNTTVYGDDNVSHIVEHSGVAAHPGDKGMQAIANSIIDILKEAQ